MATSKQSLSSAHCSLLLAPNMSSENSLVPMTNDLQTTKSGFHGVNGQISQIPGLSPTIKDLPEERARGRRVAVLESDSDYVKLAKQGGHRGLLWHEETVTYKNNSYKAPDWFHSASEDDSKLSSEEKKSPGALQPLDPPFGTDSVSAWERGDSSNNGKEKSNNVNLASPTQYYLTTKFRRIVFDKKPAPVNMSKLLSFGYAEDDKPTVNTVSTTD